MQEEQIRIELGRIEKKLEDLQKEKRKNRTIRIFSRLLILAFLLFIIFLLYCQTAVLDTKKVEALVWDRMIEIQPEISDQTFQVLAGVYPVYLRQVKKQIDERKLELLALLETETNVFLRIAEYDISEGLREGYPKLMERQKQSLYEQFPELRDREKVNRAIDNIIKNGGPKLQEVLQDKFEKHRKILHTIQAKLEKLEDTRFSDDEYLPQKTLGITLELIGKKLQKMEGEVM
ncbi:MAG: hypothetical protein JW928_08965 [Candidatus Aureabacteria bacterium]|nr:hypothetical protein [Candidatus Auribacterota bacterium]